MSETITPLQAMGKSSSRISETIGELGLERTAAVLSEGFCPVCARRGSENPPFELSEDVRPAAIVVNCMACRVHWRSGPNPATEHDWIEFTLNADDMNLSTCVNAPHEPVEDDYDGDWGDDE